MKRLAAVLLTVSILGGFSVAQFAEVGQPFQVHQPSVGDMGEGEPQLFEILQLR